MATERNLQASYVRLARARLESAGFLLQSNPRCQFDTGIDSVISRCNIAMLLWSSAVDAGSCLLIQEEQRTPSGISTEITTFITRRVDPLYPNMMLPTLWDRLVQLHNIQHRADHQVTRFVDSCRVAYQGFASINQLLTPANKLPVESYGWLQSMREE